MQTARVIGTTFATTKHPSLDGQRLKIVQPLLANGQADGRPLIAIDSPGAQVGDRVIITSDARHTRELIGKPNTPARWSILGLIDEP